MGKAVSKRNVCLVLLGVILLIFTTFVSSDSYADESTWPLEVNDNDEVTDIISHANGAVTITDCGRLTGVVKYRTWFQGDKVNDLTPPQHSLCGTGPDQIFPDPFSNTLYTVEFEIVGNMAIAKHLVALSDDGVDWSINFPCETDRVIAMKMGAARNIYVLYDATACSSVSEYRVVSFDITSQAVRFDISVGSSIYEVPESLGAYEDGIVIRSSYDLFKYYDLDGIARSGLTYSFDQDPDAVGSYLGDWMVSPNGTLYVLFQLDTMDPGCQLRMGQVKKIRSHTISGQGNEWTFGLPCVGYGSMRLMPMPENGVAIGVTTANPNSSYDDFNLFLGYNDGTTALEPLSGGHYVGMQVDEHGTILMLRQYEHEENSNMQTDVEVLLFDSSGNRISRFSTESLGDGGTGGNFELSGYGRSSLFAKSSVYVSFNRWPSVVYKLDFAQLGYEFITSKLFNLSSGSVPSHEYVALGDSFSSGEGAPPFMAATEQEDINECHRSQRAYAHLLDLDPEVNLSLQAFVACSGAKVPNITSTGQYNEDEQIEDLPSTAGVVTLTIGGNDIGFEQFVTQCLFVDCSDISVKQDFFDAIDQLGPSNLGNAYSQILTKASGADLYVVGYPQLLADDSTCNQTDPWMDAFNNVVAGANRAYQDPANATGGDIAALALVRLLGGDAGLSTAEVNDLISAGTVEFNADEIETARDLVTALNGKIQSTVGTSNPKLHFVDPNTSGSPFGGHELCSENPYFNGLYLDFENYELGNKEYSFHPNAGGQQAYAELIKSNLG